MYARQVDHRSAIFQKAMEVGEAYQLRTRALLTRSLLQKHNICVTHVQGEGKGREEGETGSARGPSGSGPDTDSALCSHV